MPEQLLIAGKDTFGGSSDTGFIGLIGPWGESFNATEANRRPAITGGGTLKNFLINVGTNTHTTASTATVRINAADGNLTVTITASTTGAFEDTGNSDAVSAGDFLGVNLVPGTGGIIEIGIIQTILDATFVSMHVSPGVWVVSSASTTFGSLMGAAAPDTTEANREYLITTAATFSNLRMFVTSNTVNGTTTITLRINGADANQTLSIAASTTGDFEDTTNNDAVAVNDLVVVQIVTGGSSGTLQTSYVQFTHDQSLQYFTHESSSATGDSFPSPVERFSGLIGQSQMPQTTLNTSIKVVAAGDTFTLRHLIVQLNANAGTSGNSEFSVQVNDADSALLILIAIGITGTFQDTSEVVVAVNDTLHCKMDHTGSANHSIRVGFLGMEAVYTPSVVGSSVAVVWFTQSRRIAWRP